MTEGAEKWLQHAEIGHNCLLAAARQLDTFILSGCAERVSKTKESKYYVPIAPTAHNSMW